MEISPADPLSAPRVPQVVGTVLEEVALIGRKDLRPECGEAFQIRKREKRASTPTKRPRSAASAPGLERKSKVVKRQMIAVSAATAPVLWLGLPHHPRTRNDYARSRLGHDDGDLHPSAILRCRRIRPPDGAERRSLQM